MDTSPMLSSRDRDSSRRGSEQIIGSSLALERVLEQVEYVAPTRYVREWITRQRDGS